MPFYDFSCGKGHRFERMVPLCDFDAPQACPCGSAARRVLVAPRVARSDSIDPIRGPDGRMHDSLSSYRRSLEPAGNPQGERYHELGTEKVKPIERTFDRGQRRDDIKAAFEDVRNGRVPPLTVLED